MMQNIPCIIRIRATQNHAFWPIKHASATIHNKSAAKSSQNGSIKFKQKNWLCGLNAKLVSACLANAASRR
jgi:hypothetical protein